MYRTLRLCTSGGGFEAVPDPPRRLDLVRIRAVLEHDGVSVVDARVMLIATLGSETTISRTGRVLIKTDDPAQAERVFRKLRPLLEEDPPLR
ncbi:MAG: hypothetical protein ACLPZM_03305 [Thermoplasmata archaeon]